MPEPQASGEKTPVPGSRALPWVLFALWLLWLAVLIWMSRSELSRKRPTPPPLMEPAQRVSVPQESVSRTP